MDTSKFESSKMKTVYAITERSGKSYWTKVGIGFTNRDGSINLRLEAIPVNGNLQVRDFEANDNERRGEGAPFPRHRGNASELGEALV